MVCVVGIVQRVYISGACGQCRSMLSSLTHGVCCQCSSTCTYRVSWSMLSAGSMGLHVCYGRLSQRCLRSSVLLGACTGYPNQSSSYSYSSAFPSYISGVHHFGVRFLHMRPFFKSNHWGNHIPSLWMVHTGCFFVVAHIHLSRTWMSGSFESVRWNACVHRLDLGIYSHPKEFWGKGVRNHVNSKGKIPSTRKILLLKGSNPRHYIKQDSEPNTLPMSYSGPHPNQ